MAREWYRQRRRASEIYGPLALRHRCYRGLDNWRWASRTRPAEGGVNQDAPRKEVRRLRFEAGDPIAFLAGGHVGCIDLRGTGKVQSVRDLRSKTVALPGGVTGASYAYLASFATYVGLDPRQDIKVAVHPPEETMRLLAEGKVDAALVSPPIAQELSAKKIGRSIVNTTTDRPWSQYFWCLISGRQALVRKYPVATKRALRAILKAADLCAAESERIAH